MKILLLGGTGAMGKPMAEILSGLELAQSICITSRTERKSKDPKISFVQGNARDNSFIPRLLEEKFDVIIDFMNYDLDEFRQRIPLLLPNCMQYIWFSSSRVYANSDKPLIECSPRLLEVTTDMEFKKTNRYALRKARQEDILFNSGFDNFTIIRPYITYNDNRLQLGILEKEQWLYRLLNHKPLVISEEMLGKITTLTYGGDVAEAVVDLIGLESSKKDIFQIAGKDTMLWREVLDLYVDTLKSNGIDNLEIYSSNSIQAIENLYEGGYNTIYDRNYNRIFCSDKIDKVIDRKIKYIPMLSGIRQCG